MVKTIQPQDPTAGGGLGAEAKESQARPEGLDLRQKLYNFKTHLDRLDLRQKLYSLKTHLEKLELYRTRSSVSTNEGKYSTDTRSLHPYIV